MRAPTPGIESRRSRRGHAPGRPSRWRTRAAIRAAATLAVLATAAPPASADPPNAPDPTWQTGGGGVHAIARTADRIYLGGAFTQLKSPGGGSSVQRTRLAALDAASGAPAAGWAPTANDVVFAVAASPDGTRVYAGGDFSALSGAQRTRLAAIDAATGAVLGWRASANGRIYSIVALGDVVFIAGSFSSVNGQSRQRVAALDADTGALVNGWNPGANGTVRSLAVAADGSAIYLGGKFASVGGASRARLAAVEPRTGNVLPWRPSVPADVMSVAATDERVVVGTAGVGGNCIAYDAGTGSEDWLVHADGNVQAVGVAGDLAYCGGHGAVADGQPRKKIFAVDLDTGALSPWNPGMNSTVGVRAIVGLGQQVSIGGDFTQVFTEARQGFAQFTDPEAPPLGVALPFADGFDRGVFGWSAVTNAGVEELAFAEAAPGVRLEVADGKAFVQRVLAAPQAGVCLEASVAVAERDQGLVLLQLISADGTSIARALVSSSGELQARSDATGATFATGVQLPPGWSAVRLCRTAGPTGALWIALDGVTIGSWSADTGTAKVGRLQIGDATGGRSFAMFVDDVAADDAPA
jgi:hypothetical protein